jgi:hypothetical protein
MNRRNLDWSVDDHDHFRIPYWTIHMCTNCRKKSKDMSSFSCLSPDTSLLASCLKSRYKSSCPCLKSRSMCLLSHIWIPNTSLIAHAWILDTSLLAHAWNLGTNLLLAHAWNPETFGMSSYHTKIKSISLTFLNQQEIVLSGHNTREQQEGEKRNHTRNRSNNKKERPYQE